MQNFSLTCFGTCDGWPSADRNHASFLYRMGKNILIDCGDSIDRCYKASGLSYQSLDAIFISHLHSDHFGGFFMLMQGCWLEGRSRPLPVFLPAGAIKPLRAMLDAAFLFDEALKFRLGLRPLSANQTVSIGSLKVKAFPTSHLTRTKARFQKKYRCDFSSFGFLLEADGRRVVHSADLGSPEDLAPVLEEPVDLLVCELAHFTPRAIFSFLKKQPVRRVGFVHVARNLYANPGPTRRMAARMLSGIPHSFPRDNAQIRF